MLGHRSFECPGNPTGQGSAHITQAKEEDVNLPTMVNVTDTGESLFLRRTLLIPSK